MSTPNTTDLVALRERYDEISAILDGVKKSVTVPTWGFHPVEPAQIFQLQAGEALPDGWHDSPVKAAKEAKAMADAAAKAEADAKTKAETGGRGAKG